MALMPSKVNSDWRTVGVEDTAFLPEYVSPAFQSLIAAADPAGAAALRRQVIASPAEYEIADSERADPLGEARYCVSPFLVHQYPNRVLLLATGRCLSYCRYCFRREFTARTNGFISAEDIVKVITYLKMHPEVQEILVSGGDPLTAAYDEIAGLLSALRKVSPELLIRLCTRAPIFAPELFTSGLIGLICSVRPLWIVVHTNHPAELGTAQCKALKRCINAGIPVLSQTVLLQGVNDDARILADLFHRLVCLGIKPGYLFQMDLARGTASFRVPLDRAASIWKELRNRLSGLSLPQFAVDLPGGGGKFPLSALLLYDDIITPLQNGSFSARGCDGTVYTYPGR